MLFTRAYANNERDRYPEALADLNAALALSPRHPLYLHERAYTLNELTRYAEAERDLDEQAALQPDEATVYQERAFSRFFQANLAGTLADRERQASLTPNDGGALIARGEAFQWVGRFPEARRDFEAALATAEGRNDATLLRDARRAIDELAAWRTLSNSDAEQVCRLETLSVEPVAPTVIGDCTSVFLGARTNAERAGALTVRAVSWRIVRADENAWVRDLQIAVALDPNNWQWRVNLGNGLIAVRHSTAGKAECVRSLELNPEGNWIALACKAAAELNLGEIDAAFADAKRSFEIRPNESALITLGDIAFDHSHNPDSAKLHWMGAYRLGGRDDGLMERLRRVDVTDPEREAAK